MVIEKSALIENLKRDRPLTANVGMILVIGAVIADDGTVFKDKLAFSGKILRPYILGAGFKNRRQNGENVIGKFALDRSDINNLGIFVPETIADSQGIEQKGFPGLSPHMEKKLRGKLL